MPSHVTPNGNGLGWRMPRPSHRYRPMFAAPAFANAIAPKSDLEPLSPPIWNQGLIGSCTGHGTAFGLQFASMKLGQPDAHRTPSRLMIYWLARYLENQTDHDVGAAVADALDGAQKWGACYEDGDAAWPYDTTRFADRPHDDCFTAALTDRALQEYRVPQDLSHLRACLSDGWPVVFGFTCYPALDSADVARTGLLPMPGPNERELGGHCVALVGHDDASRLFKARNSWGPTWGQGGYFYMPYEYVSRSDLAADFWTVRLVS